MNIQKLALLTAIVAAIPSAYAGDDYKDKLVQSVLPPKKGGPYVALFGGVNFDQSADSKNVRTPVGYQNSKEVVGAPQTANFSSDFLSNSGWYAGLKLGYVIPTRSIFLPAVELEGFYTDLRTNANFKATKKLSNVGTHDQGSEELPEVTTGPDNPIVSGVSAGASGTDTIRGGVFMANAILNLDLGRFRPYIGGGLGVAVVSHDTIDGEIKSSIGNLQLPAVNHSVHAIEFPAIAHLRVNNTSETTFAYQGIAGVDYFVTEHISVFAEYKALFFLDGPYYRNLVNQMVGGGVRLGF